MIPYDNMQNIRLEKLFFIFLSTLPFFFSCSGKPFRPCTEGGQPPHENLISPFRGTKRCFQTQDASGNTLNDGKYYEMSLDDTLATEGEYTMGKKTGRWIEYNEKGKKISDKYFHDGKEIPRP